MKISPTPKAILMVMTVLLSTPAWAQDPPEGEEPKEKEPVFVLQGEPAPWTGTLIDEAWLIRTAKTETELADLKPRYGICESVRIAQADTLEARAARIRALEAPHRQPGFAAAMGFVGGAATATVIIAVVLKATAGGAVSP